MLLPLELVPDICSGWIVPKQMREAKVLDESDSGPVPRSAEMRSLKLRE
jgi:hypothetical protein